MGKTKPAKPAKKAPAKAAAKAPAKVHEHELLAIPFKVISYNPKINARGDAQTDIEQLAESIRADGLVQPIAVRPAGKKYEPLEGGRRFWAIERLVKEKAEGWTPDTLIPVISRKLTDAEALEASIAAHITRLDLTPAQEAIAFRDLQKQGRGVEEIAATFAVQPRFVLQRLAIGSLPATILKALKAGEIDTRTAEAFTLTKDASLQVKLFTALAKKRGLNHQTVRQQLTGKATRANDAHARFVGEKAYLDAGGVIASDLFGEDRWLEDGKLLGRLFDEKVRATAERLEKEGWSFVKVSRDHWYDFESYNSQGWTRIQPKGQQSADAGKRRTEIDAKIGHLSELLKKPMGESRRQEIAADRAGLINERASIPTSSFTSEQLKKAGVVIRIDSGRIEIMYGMVDPASRKAEEKAQAKAAKKKAADKAKTKAIKGKPAGASTQVPGKAQEIEEPDFTGALKTDLAKEMGGALQMSIADKPQAAQYLLIANLVINAIKHEIAECDAQTIAISGTPYVGSDYRYGEPEKTTNGHKAFEDLLGTTLKTFVSAPAEGKKKRTDQPELSLLDILTKLEQLEHQDLMKLQALLVARALAIGMGFMEQADMQTVISRFDPDVRKWWTPDKEFFGRLKKPDLIQALEEAAAVSIPRSGSKGQLVELATADLPGKGWLPKPLRAPSYAGPGSNAWADAQGARVAEAVAGKALAPAVADGEPQRQAAE